MEIRRLLYLFLFIIYLNNSHAIASENEAFNSVGMSVVHIQVNAHDRNGRSLNEVATGVILDKQGHILTNYHPFKKIEEKGVLRSIEVSLGDKRLPGGEATVVSSDKVNDISILKINSESPLIRLNPGCFSTNDPSLVTKIYTLGFPGDINLVRGEGKTTTYNAVNNLYGTSIPMDKGQSGSPVFTVEGKIVGILTGTEHKAENVHLYRPTKQISNFISAYIDEDCVDDDSGEESQCDSRPLLSQFSDKLEDTLCKYCPEMTVIPPGQFTIGSQPGITWPDKKSQPQTKISIDYSFSISTNEITVPQWLACVKAGGCNRDAGGNNVWDKINSNVSVEFINYYDALDYTKWLSRITKNKYRLPSEAEWEYAARAGSNDTLFPWGDRMEKNRVICWNCPGDHHKTPINEPLWTVYPANEFGLYNMLGNVGEIVADCWTKNHEQIPTDGRAKTFEGCTRRVVRGGSYLETPNYNRSFSRTRNWANDRSQTNGFRVVRNLCN